MIEPHADAADQERSARLRRFAHDAMACTFELWLVEPDAAYAEQVAQAAFAEVDRLEGELSCFIPTSDIARINALKVGQAARVGIEAVECLQLAAQLYGETGGAFDITFGSEATQPRSGSPLELDPKGRYVRARSDAVRVDLGGMGKGYVVDQVVTILRDWSVSAALVHAGQSTVFALGRPSNADGWLVTIRNPVDYDDALGVARISEAALSGSGRKLHGDHIIDPRSGRAVSDKLGAWALAPSAALADALSTAFMVMSPDEVTAYCRRHAEVSALVYANTPSGAVLSRFGKGWVFERPVGDEEAIAGL